MFGGAPLRQTAAPPPARAPARPRRSPPPAAAPPRPAGARAAARATPAASGRYSVAAAAAATQAGRHADRRPAAVTMRCWAIPDAGPQLSTAGRAREPAHHRRPALPARAEHGAICTPIPTIGRLASPNLLDAYFDARPNDRVRAFILGRVSYDPTAPPGGNVDAALPPARPARRAARWPATRRPASPRSTPARPQRHARPDVDLVRHRARGLRHRRQAARALGHRPLLDADRLSAPGQAQPAGRIRRPPRHHHAQAAFPVGVAGVELLRLRCLGGSQRRHQHPRSDRRRGPRRVGRRARPKLGLDFLVKRGQKLARRRRFVDRRRRLRFLHRHRDP